METKQQAAERLGSALKLLMANQPKNRMELDEWNIKARDLEQELRKEGGLASDVPHLLWHFLADADIRMKSHSYRKMQDAQMQILCAHLVRGVIPPDEALSVRSDPQ